MRKSDLIQIPTGDISQCNNDPANILKGLRESALYLRNASF